MIRQYIDGELDVEFGPAGKINSIDVVFRIGKAQTGLSGMVGLVDEVAIYNRALSVDEINQDMENGVFFAVSPKDKLCYNMGSVEVENVKQINIVIPAVLQCLPVPVLPEGRVPTSVLLCILRGGITDESPSSHDTMRFS